MQYLDICQSEPRHEMIVRASAQEGREAPRCSETRRSGLSAWTVLVCCVCAVHLVSGERTLYALTDSYVEDTTLTYDVEETRTPCTNVTYNRTCCNFDEFQCSDGYCIPDDKLCDSKLDCPDSSDEAGCLSMGCEDRVEVRCEQMCTDLPGNKSRCLCKAGYSLKTTAFRQTCQDIDECQLGTHVCSHGCKNLNGSYQCTCKEGFSLTKQDGLPETCKAHDQNIQVLYSSDSWIYSYLVEEHKVKPVVHAGRVDEMDYDPVTEMVYWSTRHRVARSYLLGAADGHVSIGHPQSVGPSSIWHIKNSLAIDWTAGNLYWISVDILNVEKYQILVSKLDGRYVKTLLDDVAFASSLVVDPEYGKMYWTSGGDNAEIGSAWMNGMYRGTVVRLGSASPLALTLDHMTAARLYWADSKSNKIYYVYTDGTRPTEVVTTLGDLNPLMMDVFENYLYWVTRGSKQLVKFDKFGRGNITYLVEHLIDQTSVKVFHKRRVDVQIRKAGLYCRSQCSHLCLHVPRGYSCSCPDGSRLLLLLGEILCDSEREDPLEDPLACNCEETEKICNASSPYSKCHCKQSCEEGDADSYTESYDDYETVTAREYVHRHDTPTLMPRAASASNINRLLFLLLCVTPVFICFALSFCKRPERRTTGAAVSSLSQQHSEDNFARPMGFSVPDDALQHGYAQGGPTIVRGGASGDVASSPWNNGLDNPLYQVPTDSSRDSQASAQLLVP